MKDSRKDGSAHDQGNRGARAAFDRCAGGLDDSTNGWRPEGSAGMGRGEGNAGMSDDEYVYDELSGEWLPASELAQRRAADSQVEVRDAVGNLLADGDQVTLIKDLEVKGAGQTLKRGTLIKSIRLTGDPQEIDCKYEGIRGLVLRAEFVKKR